LKKSTIRASHRHYLCDKKARQVCAVLIALAGVGNMMYIGSQSKFIPYVVAVGKLGQTIAVPPMNRAKCVDCIHASTTMA
jgi:type IV secretory pathway TrbF-like protein